MLLHPRIFPGDEELGKRDDDHKPGKPSPLANVLMHSRLPQRRSLKRLGILLVVLVGFYFFFKNMPTDVGPRSRRSKYTYEPDNAVSNWNNGKTHPYGGNGPSRSPTKVPEEAATEKHWFNGAIKFYKLAASLHAIARNGGGSWANQNVLFAASSLKSASALLPMACEMSILKRNNVHFALFGRDDVSLEMLKEVNGVEKGCDIYYHDARPDYSVQSSDYRMEVSCGAALNHINNFMHPKSVIIDGSTVEDPFFIKGIRNKANTLDKTLIGLPKNAEQNLMWITRLDSSSLSAWNKVSVNILIHAQSAASGSLLRLLSSLSNADYFSSTPPALTIELPQEIDGPTQQHLQTFKWPPASHGHVEGNSNRLTLRHRIPQYDLKPEESSARFLESFWPADPATSHVLVLSPQVELSPLFFHYLKYTLLEYKYGLLSANERTLMGISLDLPSTYLNDSTNFFAPFMKDSPPSDIETTAPFLWQAPNSNAALYFGDHWIELHSFITKSLASKHELPTATNMNKKLVSKTYPSWLEYILSLSRARGYALLYPNLANQTALATVHNELYRPPEEFKSEKDDQTNKYTGSEEDWVVDSSHLSLQHEEMPLAKTSLLNILPSDSVLPGIGLIPHLTWDGNEVSELYKMRILAETYAETFRRETGGCSLSDEVKMKVDGSADDLFCLGKEKDEYGARIDETKETPVSLNAPGIADPPGTTDAAVELETIPKDGLASKADATHGAEKPSKADTVPPAAERPVVADDDDAPVMPAQIVEDTVNLGNKVQTQLDVPVTEHQVEAADEILPKKPAQIVEDTVEAGKRVMKKVDDMTAQVAEDMVRNKIQDKVSEHVGHEV